MIRRKLVSLLPVQSITPQSVAIAALMALSLLLFYDPLSGLGIASWDRSFCDASLAGIDPSRRVSHFYRLYLVYFPCLCGVFALAISALLKKREIFRFGISFGIFFVSLFMAYALREGSLVCGIVAQVLAVSTFVGLWVVVAFSCRRQELVKPKRAGPFLDAVAEGLSARGLDRFCVMGAFSLILLVTALYSKFAVPFFAGHSVWFEKYADRFGFVLSDTSAMFLVLLALLYVWYLVRKESCDVYRAFVTFLFVSITLSLLMPIPVVLNGIVALALLLFVQKKKIEIMGRLELFVWFPLVFCLGCELVFTLIEKEMVGFAPVYGAYAIAAVFMALAFFKKGNLSFFARGISNDNFYVGALLSFTALAYFRISYGQLLPNILDDYQGFYEYGNFLGALDTLAKSEIPVIDYFSAHALCDVFSKIMHGLIHGSYVGALIDPYRDFVCYACGGLALFFALSKMWGPFFAFSLVCLFPLTSNAFLFVDVCLVALPLHFWLYRKIGVPKFLLFWLLAALNAFYKYDTGVAFGIAAIFSTFVLFACRRDKASLVKFALAGVSVGLLLFLFYVVYCGYRGIPFDGRIKEWISLTLHSNPYWAFEQLAPMKVSFAYAAVYYFIPLAESLVIFCVLIESFRKRDLEKSAALSLLFSVVGLFLLMRAFVYHTLLHTQGSGSLIFCYGVFALLFFAFHLLKKFFSTGVAKMAWLTLAFVAVWLCNLPNHFLPDTTGVVASKAVSNIALVRDGLRVESCGAGRYALDDTLNRYAVEWGTVFSSILLERETFLDFANVPLLYALTGRERPFYSAQSPGLLTDLYSQEMFLKEIESHEVPVAITGYSGKEYLQSVAKVPHHIRYYKIAEYLYAHYRPLARLGDFVIWCIPDRYETYSRKLTSVKVPLEFIEYAYQSGGDYHYFDLRWNPYVWANLDKFNAAGNGVLEDAQPIDGAFRFRGSRIDLDSLGNYISMDIESVEDSLEAKLMLFETNRPDSQYGYSFKLKKGNYKYLIRSSQDYNWFAYNINSARLECRACAVGKVQILRGD